MQTVNFLSDLPKEKKILSFSHFALALIAAVVLCFLISSYLIACQYFASRELRQVEKNRASEAVLFQQVAKSYPLLASEVPLDKKLRQLAERIMQRQKEFEAISHTTLRTGFSEYMTTLALVTPNALWLTDFSINQDAKTISIQGLSKKAAAVASLIQKLNDSQVFKGLHFDLFNVEWNKSKRVLAFEIANEELKSKTDVDDDDEAEPATVVKADVTTTQGVTSATSI